MHLLNDRASATATPERIGRASLASASARSLRMLAQSRQPAANFVGPNIAGAAIDGRAPQRPRHTPDIVACVDRSAHAAKVASVAMCLADALSAPLTLFEVIEADAPLRGWPDPLESEFRRHQSYRHWDRLIKSNPEQWRNAKVELAEGDGSDRICQRAAMPDTVLVIGSRGDNTAQSRWGSTVVRVLERAQGPVLLVPAEIAEGRRTLRKLVVPLDGSDCAEAALPTAVLIARATMAEIILVHVAPGAELTVVAPLCADDLRLQDDLQSRNARIANAYLEQQMRHLADQGVAVRAICRMGDVRETLARIIGEQHCDLVVMSNRGQGMRSGLELPYGSVASYLMAHVPIPMLVVRPVSQLAPAIPSGAVLIQHGILPNASA